MRIQFLAKVLLLIMAAYSFVRFVFFCLNFQLFSHHPATLMAASFAHGLRFDLSTILMINGVFILLCLAAPAWLFYKKAFQKLLKFLFIGLNFPCLLASIADAEYYKFTGQRMNLDVLLFRSEATKQMDQFLVNYWYLMVLSLGLLGALFLLYPKVSIRVQQVAPVWWKQTLRMGVWALTLVLILLFGIRGGFQPKPLQPVHAYSSGSSPELGVLTLNSAFTIIKTRRGVNLQPVKFFATNDEVFKLLKPQKNVFERSPASSKKQNVVIIILESFGAEFWGAVNLGRGFTPFLDELSKHGALFKNSYANGRRSIDALPAVLFGVPSFVHTPIVKTNYYSNKWNGLGHIAQRAGVYTSFFHGAPKGTMYFDAIAAMAGFENFFPLESYPKGEDFDGHWGVYDEPFLQFMVSKLNTQPQPFLSTAFTISSHQPYHVPEQYQNILPRGRLQIHQSIAYVDYALKRFFQEAQKQPWYKDTLFVITGDHSQMSETELQETTLGRHHVPLLLFHPSQNLSSLNTRRVTHHPDILPTLLDFWGLEREPYLLFGRSVFDSSQEGEAVFYTFGGYWLVRENHFLHLSDKDFRGTLYATNDPQQQHPILDREDLRRSMENRMKSYIQYYNNSLIENSLYSWFEQ